MENVKRITAVAELTDEESSMVKEVSARTGYKVKKIYTMAIVEWCKSQLEVMR